MYIGDPGGKGLMTQSLSPTPSTLAQIKKWYQIAQNDRASLLAEVTLSYIIPPQHTSNSKFRYISLYLSFKVVGFMHFGRFISAVEICVI